MEENNKTSEIEDEKRGPLLARQPLRRKISREKAPPGDVVPFPCCPRKRGLQKILESF